MKALIEYKKLDKDELDLAILNSKLSPFKDIHFRYNIKTAMQLINSSFKQPAWIPLERKRVEEALIEKLENSQIVIVLEEKKIVLTKDNLKEVIDQSKISSLLYDNRKEKKLLTSCSRLLMEPIIKQKKPQKIYSDGSLMV